MGLENPAVKLTGKAYAALTSYQYCAAKFVSGVTSGYDFGVTVATATTDSPAGIIQNAPAINSAVELTVLGVSKYMAGGTIHVGDKLTAMAGGKLIATVTDKNNYWGVALTEAVDGDVGTMYVHRGMISLA